MSSCWLSTSPRIWRTWGRLFLPFTSGKNWCMAFISADTNWPCCAGPNEFMLTVTKDHAGTVASEAIAAYHWRLKTQTPVGPSKAESSSIEENCRKVKKWGKRRETSDGRTGSQRGKSTEFCCLGVLLLILMMIMSLFKHTYFSFIF